jgi:hypothetical protein
MAYDFRDGFDCYAATADATAGYWDSGTPINFSLVAGRFTGSQAVAMVNTGVYVMLAKSSGVNDAVHHVSIAVRQTSVLSGTTLTGYLQFSDGATNQCCIVFRSDGVVLLTSATPAGTVLATYTGAITAQNAWTAFEFEIIISNTVGRFRARKNGNTSDDFDSGASLNTRPGTNAWANKLTLGSNGSTILLQFDDLIWRSDAASVPWLGDQRCYVQMPASDASTQFARAPAIATQGYTQVGTTAVTAGTARYGNPVVATFDGAISTVSVSMAAGYTGNMKCSLFSASATGTFPPTTVLGSATPIVNPVTGTNTFTFPTPVVVAKGQIYTVGFISDTTSGTWNSSGGSSGQTGTGVSYGAFPAANPATTGAQAAATCTIYITVGNNFGLVNEAQQDGTTTYVYDATVGHADLYAIAPLPASPIPVASVSGVVTRAFMAKGDAGARSGQVQLKSFGAFSPTTWNPSDKAAGITLSGSNLIATNNSSSTSGVRAVANATSGKFYWEYTCNTFTFSANAVGVARSSMSLTGGPGDTGNFCVTTTGAIYANGTSTGVNVGSITAGALVCIAIDATAHLGWIRLGPTGNWNNSGTANPATGVGGITIPFDAANPFYPWLSTSNLNDQVTANFGASGLTGVAPSGFTAGFGSIPSTTVTSTPLVLSSSFLWNSRTDLVNPNGGAAWTVAAVNAIQVGPVVQA